jgi:hypothetical protein
MVARTENEIADMLASIPGVSSVGFAGSAPMGGSAAGWEVVNVEGKTYEGDPPLLLINYVSPGYFGVLGTRLLADATSRGRKSTTSSRRSLSRRTLHEKPGVAPTQRSGSAFGRTHRGSGMR